jgi:2-polyprenyl-6-methoxyphenol hydroxylase-like FAD-dependent oxidoreductase
MNAERTTCLVAGGGPAGIVLGLLLARAGVEVTVLEKHGDFLRDFRGDTVHPSTMDLLDELGLGEQFAQLPHRKVEQAQLPYGNGVVTFADFTKLDGKHKHRYISLVPQWDLLDLLAGAAKEEPSFTLRMNTEATGLVVENGRVTGVEYRTREGETGRIRADLTVACDGRTSVLRKSAAMRVRDWPTPLDVWWFRLPRKDSDPTGAVGVVSHRRAVVLLDRGSYWQSATLIKKGSDAESRSGPVRDLAASIAEVAPWLADRVDSLQSWDEVKLLDVRLDRLDRWYRDGLLCLGDAAHAMSPVGGVGINLAVQDAVAAGTILAEPLRTGTLTTADLAKVQRRRWPATFVVQSMQRVLHSRVLSRVVAGDLDIVNRSKPPLPMRLAERFPRLRAIPAYAIGYGFRPEHAPDFARRPTVGA